MNFNIFVGIFIAIIAIYFGAPDVRNDVGVYIQGNAFTLVLLGTIGSTLVSTSFGDFRSIFTLIKNLFFKRRTFLLPKNAIDAIVKVAEEAQHSSRQSLPDCVRDINDRYLNRSLEMVAAGLDKEFVLQTLQTDIDEMQSRHAKKVLTVRTMGTFAPMFGMAGTVIGVIQVLKNVTDIDNIVSGMALALLTTLYGLFFSSILFIPLSNKLKNLSEEEVLAKTIILEGISMVLDKEIPLKVEKYLMAYLMSGQKELIASKT